jgi:predicted RNA-binding Zn ribbon-like protein
MSQGLAAKSPFEFLAGNPGLDFANTVNGRSAAHPEELLTDYSRLLQWGEEAGVITKKTAERLSVAWQAAPARAQASLRNAVVVRDAIYDVFSAVAERRVAPGAQVAVLNKAICDASKHLQIAYDNQQFIWEWICPEDSFDSVLWPVARAAVNLLTSEQLTYVRLCAADTCKWLFLDTTKNHRRRWCEMKTCGNRSKAKRYYRRQKAD